MNISGIFLNEDYLNNKSYDDPRYDKGSLADGNTNFKDFLNKALANQDDIFRRDCDGQH